jgi:chemotaxis protein MotB
MGKDPFEDPELQAMRASMRPSAGQTRWGRIFTGVLVVACVTFAVAYYLPLLRAHTMLVTRFSELSSKLDAANRVADASRRKEQELNDKHQALQTQLAEIQQRTAAGAEASRAIKSALESKLQKAIAGEQAAVGAVDGEAVVSLSLASLLTRGKLEVSPAGKVVLCSVASANGNHPIRVVAIAGKKDIPPAVVAKLKTPFELNLALAELVTNTLIDQCKAAPTKLSATGVPADPAPGGPKLDGKRLAGARIELWLETAP